MKNKKILRTLAIAIISILFMSGIKAYSADAIVKYSETKTVTKNGLIYSYYSIVQSYNGNATARTRVEGDSIIAKGSVKVSTYLINYSTGGTCKSVSPVESTANLSDFGVVSPSCSGSHDHYVYGVVSIKSGSTWSDYTTHSTGSISSRTMPLYSVNMNNQKYGSIICEAYQNVSLDLVSVTGINGLFGYVYKDLLQLPYNEATLVPVYENDGITIIDQFLIEVGIVE